MEAGNIVHYTSPDYPGETDIGFILYLDTDEKNEVVYVIRWSDGVQTREWEESVLDGTIKVIQ